ncbi:hypothetical protein R1flu_023196 [Riccia fluitans]|uniref:Uncharacterized protein n=1 Tax=Riccia fluitans TaxID=41844 RepID=A0ABD1XRU7_9MARC
MRFGVEGIFWLQSVLAHDFWRSGESRVRHLSGFVLWRTVGGTSISAWVAISSSFNYFALRLPRHFALPHRSDVLEWFAPNLALTHLAVRDYLL